MGTFWETGVYTIAIPNKLWQHTSETAPGIPTSIEYTQSHKVVSSTNTDNTLSENPAGKAAMTPVIRRTVTSEREFDEILRDSRPVVIEGIDLGNCLQRWNPEYMVDRVGEHTEVIAQQTSSAVSSS